MLSAATAGVIGELASSHAPHAAPAAAQVAAPAKAALAAAVKPFDVVNGIDYSGPITITRGGTYTGNWESLDGNVPAVRIRTSQPVIIENSNIRSRSSCIDVADTNANLIVRNTRGYGLNPNIRGQNPGRFLDVDGFSNIVAEHNYLENTAGMYFFNYEGNHTASQTVTVRYNQALNIDGRTSNGNDGWLNVPANPDHYMQFVQFNGLKNMSGVDIGWNQVVNQQGLSRVEENINIFASTGSKFDPIRIHDNYIQGAYAGSPADSKAYTGGGIMVSDQGASFIQVANNQIVQSGQIGIVTTSGHDNSIVNNRIVCAGILPSGKRIPWPGTGLVIWNFNKEKTFNHNSAQGNLVGWVTKNSRSDWWVPDVQGFKGNKHWPGKLTLATEYAEFAGWQNKLKANGFTVGPV